MLLLFLSSILLVLSFPNFNLSYLVFIGFVPLFFAIQNQPPKNVFLISCLCGFLFYLGTLYWLYHVTVFGLIVLSLYLALYFGVFGLIFRLFTIHHSLFTSLLISTAWVFLEYIQARLFTGFGWALLGYSQYKNLPLIQIADFAGVYGVSFVIMLANVAIYRLFKRSFREIIIAGMVFVAVIAYGMVKEAKVEEGSTVKISIVQGNIPQDMKWDPDAAEYILDKYIDLTRLAAFDAPDLIIWPETSFPGFFEEDRRRTQSVLDLASDINIPILLGANTYEGLRNFNSAVLVSDKGEIADRYDKIHLVPFGEYVPFSERFPALHNLVLGELGEFTAGKDFKIFQFTIHNSPFTANFATLICYEDIFPEISREFVKNGARFLVVITNDAWYGKTGAPYQHSACSVFRAIENRVSIVRCANTGLSCFIDSKGRIYDAVEDSGSHLFITGHKTSKINLSSP